MDATTHIHTLQKYLFKIGLEETQIQVYGAQ